MKTLTIILAVIILQGCMKDDVEGRADCTVINYTMQYDGTLKEINRNQAVTMYMDYGTYKDEYKNYEVVRNEQYNSAWTLDCKFIPD